MKPEILKIDANHPEPALIARAVTILNEGGVIAYPTETFYGLGVHAGNVGAVERIFAIKGRSFRSPIALIMGKSENLGVLVKEVPTAANRLMEAFWPGPLTLVFLASDNIIPGLTAGTGTIGIRVSSNPIASALARGLLFPITATSANLSGAGECAAAQEVVDSLGENIDCLIDGGHTPGGLGSTVLDMTKTPPAMLREGAISAGSINAELGEFGQQLCHDF